MSPSSGAISTSRGPSDAICRSTLALPRKLISCVPTVNAELIASRFIAGVEMLTAMTTSPQSLRASSIGRLLAIPPSTSRRPSISTGAMAPGTDMLARIARDRLPRESTTASPVSMSAATARNGIGSLSKSPTSTACCVSWRKNPSIETPAISPLGRKSDPGLMPYSGANSVL